MFKIDITPKNRFLLAILWSIVTISLCYISLYLSIMFLGSGIVFEEISGDLYTYIPAIMAIIFIIVFKTDILSLEHFRNPGFKWLAFGIGYTVVVLSLTLITDFIIGGLKYNPNFTPFVGDNASYSTHNQILDLIMYFTVVAVLYLFATGGFIRIVGEEVGWRGYLFPELLKLHPKLSLIISTFIVGLVWFTYHLPYFTVLAPVASDKIIFLIIASIGVFFGANWAMLWTYLKTKNLWPALLLHYSWNLANPVFLGNLYDGSLGLFNPSINNLWLINGEGLVGGMFHFLVGLFFLVLIIKDRDQLFKNYTKLDTEYHKNSIPLPKRRKLRKMTIKR